jgi:hypothetical protein
MTCSAAPGVSPRPIKSVLAELNEFCHRNAQGIGNLVDVLDRDIPPAFFYGTNVSSVQVSELRQTFLGQISVLTNLANRESQGAQ